MRSKSISGDSVERLLNYLLMFHFPQGCENRFPSRSELLPCEQVPERANFRNIPWTLVMNRNSLWTFTYRCYQDVRRINE
ncbi:hypothetical protein BpHYR1_042883 [Brachionus plicatilis]|uniref:Uncharacterized protein n=1 Tax=Brachionus plicatilis TaxID=10195 RepID=A0A3M7RKL4_BRAPC|nr:hypothetical protein BpHYR1_042883 [Brachionus plicatilis]